MTTRVEDFIAYNPTTTHQGRYLTVNTAAALIQRAPGAFSGVETWAYYLAANVGSGYHAAKGAMVRAFIETIFPNAFGGVYADFRQAYIHVVSYAHPGRGLTESEIETIWNTNDNTTRATQLFAKLEEAAQAPSGFGGYPLTHNRVSLALISSWDKNRNTTSGSDFDTITTDYQTVLTKAATW